MADFIARILVVDDQPASVHLLIAYMQDRQIGLLVARHGNDALRIATDGRPDLVLLDVMMPGTDGFTMGGRLQADARTAAILAIFLSAAMETEDKLRGVAAGGADYINKPFSEQEVLARLFIELGDRPRLGSAHQPDPGCGTRLEKAGMIEAFGSGMVAHWPSDDAPRLRGPCRCAACVAPQFSNTTSS
jgi:CheY-like chemotaxis protein